MMIVLFFITYFGMSDIVESGSSDENDTDVSEELDERPKIQVKEFFKYKVSKLTVVLQPWSVLCVLEPHPLRSSGADTERQVGGSWSGERVNGELLLHPTFLVCRGQRVC